jgi:hypothetical protein
MLRGFFVPATAPSARSLTFVVTRPILLL